MSDEKMTLTQAHSHLVNFVAAFDAAASLAEAAKTVLDAVGDPVALEHQAVDARERLAEANNQLSVVEGAIQSARDEHIRVLHKIRSDTVRRREELDEQYRQARAERQEQARVDAEEDKRVVDDRRVTLEASLAGLTEQIEAKRLELARVESLVKTANAELESVRQLVGARGK